jgi:hypothetical protein
MQNPSALLPYDALNMGMAQLPIQAQIPDSRFQIPDSRLENFEAVHCVVISAI